VINDPVFVGSKLYKNGKFELELVRERWQGRRLSFFSHLTVSRRRHCRIRLWLMLPFIGRAERWKGWL